MIHSANPQSDVFIIFTLVALVSVRPLFQILAKQNKFSIKNNIHSHWR